ncbi:hypothetical protein GSY71_03590 [Pusillimonas sp. TS35]|nr:hypothetical protein [Pusillimonas sp. TS35]
MCGLLLCMVVAATPAHATDDCDAPVARWQPRAAVADLADREGWTIRSIKIDDGCYEIRGEDSAGRPFKAKLDPETLKIVKWRNRDRPRRLHGRDEPDTR